MTEPQTDPRPPQVSTAGWITIGGSGFLLVSLFSQLANLRSLETREQVEKMLAEAPFKGSGITVANWLDVMHVALLVTAGCAVAAGVFGVFVLRRDKGARIGLSVVAVPLMITGLFAGALLASLVAASAVMLWSGPARDWFAGRPIRPGKASRVDSNAQPPMPGPAAPPTAYPPAGQPPADPPPIAVPDPRAQVMAAWPHAHPYAQPHPQPHPQPEPRPRGVVIAAVVTWVFGGLVIVGMGLPTLALILDPTLADEILRQQPELAELDMSNLEFLAIVYLMVAALVLWSIVAMGLALLVFLRKRWAWPLLLASAIGASLFSLMTISAIAPVVTFAASSLVTYLLLQPEVRRWLAAPGQPNR